MKIASNKISDITRFFRSELRGIYDEPELETIISWCFEHFLGMDRTRLLLSRDATVSESDLLKFSFAVKDLKAHRPIQYILGEADFCGMRFRVNEQVLIPRPETEELVGFIVTENGSGKGSRVLDIGTGSGCIAIALSKKLRDAEVFALDVSPGALKIAKENAERLGRQIGFIQTDILVPDAALPGELDIIVSNPPYVTRSEIPAMRKNVLDHEPHLALFVENGDPLIFYRVIADIAMRDLKNGGSLYFEINSSLGAETQQLLVGKGFKNVRLHKDLSNNYRILRGSK